MGYNQKAYDGQRPGVKEALKRIESLQTRNLMELTADERQAVLFHFEQLRRAESKERADKNRTEKRISVSAKGGVAVYGFGRRFPTTLYPEEWKLILAMKEEIEAFIVANKDLIEANQKMAKEKKTTTK